MMALKNKTSAFKECLDKVINFNRNILECRIAIYECRYPLMILTVQGGCLLIAKLIASSS